MVMKNEAYEKVGPSHREPAFGAPDTRLHVGLDAPSPELLRHSLLDKDQDMNEHHEAHEAAMANEIPEDCIERSLPSAMFRRSVDE